MFNKIIIIGRLGCTPVIRRSKTGQVLCAFNVAVDTIKGGVKTTDWYSVSVFGKQAASCEKYLQRGSLVCVTGSLMLRKFKAKDGTDKTCLKLTADNVTFIASSRKKPVPAEKSETPNGIERH
jgi:single-strand DNA-binding protein